MSVQNPPEVPSVVSDRPRPVWSWGPDGAEVEAQARNAPLEEAGSIELVGRAVPATGAPAAAWSWDAASEMAVIPEPPPPGTWAAFAIEARTPPAPIGAAPPRPAAPAVTVPTSAAWRSPAAGPVAAPAPPTARSAVPPALIQPLLVVVFVALLAAAFALGEGGYPVAGWTLALLVACLTALGVVRSLRG